MTHFPSSRTRDANKRSRGRERQIWRERWAGSSWLAGASSSWPAWSSSPIRSAELHLAPPPARRCRIRAAELHLVGSRGSSAAGAARRERGEGEPPAWSMAAAAGLGRRPNRRRNQPYRVELQQAESKNKILKSSSNKPNPQSRRPDRRTKNQRSSSCARLRPSSCSPLPRAPAPARLGPELLSAGGGPDLLCVGRGRWRTSNKLRPGLEPRGLPMAAAELGPGRPRWCTGPRRIKETRGGGRGGSRGA